MAKFRARPGVEIEAFQWTGQPPREWPVWANVSTRIRYEITCLYVDGAHGAVRVNSGDWVILKSDKDIYPCSDAVFKERWEPV